MSTRQKIVSAFLVITVLNVAISITDAAPEVRYRGFTVVSMDQAVLEEAVNKWNANQVRYMICPDVWRMTEMKMPSVKATWDKLMADLPKGLDIAKSLGLAVVLDLHQLPIDNPKKYSSDGRQNSHLWWQDETNLKAMIDCWKQIAQICKDRDQVIWFDLWNEPLDWTVVHSQPSYPANWPIWAQKIINEIRKIDTRHPIAIEPGPGMLCWGFKGFPLLKDPYQKLIYSVHVYQPVEYTHQGVQHQNILAWPGVFGDSGGGGWDKKHLLQEYAPAIEYQKKHGVRIWVGEFSAPRWAPGAEEYLRDCIEIFEKLGWDWNYHALKEARVWNLDAGDEVDLYDANGKYLRTGIAEVNSGLKYPTYGTPGKKPALPPKEMTARAKVIKEYLQRNKTIVKKILVIGNSISRHGPNGNLGWNGNYGMAASSQEKDYVHQVYAKICQVQPQFKPELRITRPADESKMIGGEAYLDYEPDLVIVQLGDNFRGKANVEELQKPYEKILTSLKEKSNPAIFCLSTWGNPQFDPLIREAAKNQRAVYVDISSLSGNSANRAAAEKRFTNGGVNWHPGDQGMQAIAESLWARLKEQFKWQRVTEKAVGS